MLITLDIETNTSHDTIWVAVTQDFKTGEMLEHYSAETLEPLLRDSECVIGHKKKGTIFLLTLEKDLISLRLTPLVL